MAVTDRELEILAALIRRRFTLDQDDPIIAWERLFQGRYSDQYDMWWGDWHKIADKGDHFLRDVGVR